MSWCGKHHIGKTTENLKYGSWSYIERPQTEEMEPMTHNVIMWQNHIGMFQVQLDLKI